MTIRSQPGSRRPARRRPEAPPLRPPAASRRPRSCPSAPAGARLLGPQRPGPAPPWAARARPPEVLLHLPVGGTLGLPRSPGQPPPRPWGLQASPAPRRRPDSLSFQRVPLSPALRQPTRGLGPHWDALPATKALKAPRLSREGPVPDGGLSAQERKISHLLNFLGCPEEKFTKSIHDVIDSWVSHPVSAPS